MQLTLTSPGLVSRAVQLPKKHHVFSASKILPQRVVRCAAASQDPYDVLGLPSNADYNAIQRAYKKKLRCVPCFARKFRD